MIERVLNRIESQRISPPQWISGFVGILFIRFLFESLASPTRAGLLTSNSITLVHYGLFWTTLILGLILIIGFFSKNYLSTSKIALFGLPIIWVAPIVDIIISRGSGYTQSYILDTGQRLVIDFFTFFGPTLTWGATYGIRLEILIVLLGTGWYLRRMGKNVLQILVGLISVYLLGFILASWPAILYTLSHIHNQASTLPDIYNYFGKIIFKSTISHNTIYEGSASLSLSRFFELTFDKFAAQVLFIVSFFLCGFLFWKIDKKKFLSITQNIRLERIGSYLALLVCGMGFAYINKLGNQIAWIDLVGIVCLIISWIGLWMYAVHNNDIADIKIDEISNTERPLIKKEVSEKEMKETAYLWLSAALLGSWCAGFYPFFMSLIYISASHLYSSPPLRLRQFPIISSFLIAVASLATVFAGFFFISIDKHVQAFPMLLAFGIVIMVTLAINVKDMKDIEGDKTNGVMTLPILFGENGPKIVGICFALSFLLVPIFLSFYYLYILAIPASIVGYRLVTKKPYKEDPIFILRFIFLSCVAIVYGGILWLANTYYIQ